jgi:hypothetical protein
MNDAFEVQAHTGALAYTKACWLDETGRAYLETNLGFGLVHTMDVARLATALEQGIWACQECQSRELPELFGYERSPQWAQAQKTDQA